MRNKKTPLPCFEAQHIETKLDERDGRSGVHELDEVAQRVRVGQDLGERLCEAIGPLARVN